MLHVVNPCLLITCVMLKEFVGNPLNRQRWALCNEQLGSEAVVALQILLEQPISRVRAKGLKACDRWLWQHGLPGSKKVKIRWPSVLPRNVFKACLIPSCY